MTKNKQNIIYLLLAFLIALSLSTMLVYIRKQMVKDSYLHKRTALIDEKNSYVFDLLEKMYTSAERYNKMNKNSFEFELRKAYKSKEEFDKDFNSSEITKLSELQTKYSQGYFNYIGDIGEHKSDNNDNHIADLQKIREDGSGNCLAFGRTRTHEEEATQHFNQDLALLAAEDLNKKMKRRSFWIFLHPKINSRWYKDLESLKTTDIDYLKELFVKHGSDVSFFKSIEFLVRHSINEKEDLFGREFIQNGIYNENAKIININQGFNFYDQIQANSWIVEDIEKYNTKISALDREFFNSMSVYNFFIVALFLIFFLLFLQTASLKK